MTVAERLNKRIPLMGSSRRMLGTNNTNRKPGCPIPLQSGCMRGLPLPSSFEEGVKMECSNSHCPYQEQLMHPECFHALEDNLIKIMSNLGSARGWTDAQRRSNLWDKKGLSLIQRKCRCLCGLGLMRLDETAIFLANQNAAAAIPSAPPKSKKGKKNLPKLNFGSNVTAHMDKHYTKRENKKRINFLRSLSPTDSAISVTSSVGKHSRGSERRAVSHTLCRGKLDSGTRNTKSEYGWIPQKSVTPIAVVERKQVRKSSVFCSKKVDANVSYAEAALVKPDNEIIFSESQFPRAEDVGCLRGMRSLSFCTGFNSLQKHNLYTEPRSLPLLDSLEFPTKTSITPSPFEDMENSVNYSISSDGVSDSLGYYQFDADGFFVGPLDTSMAIPSPPETPSGPLSITDLSQTTSSEKDLRSGNTTTEVCTGYYDLFSGCSFGLGELLIAESYLPGLL